MNDVFSIVSLAGQWIVQSANYSLLACPDYTNLFVNQVQWTYIKKHKPCLESVKQYLNEEYELSNISTYCIESTNRQIHSVHYIVFVYRGSRIKLLIKLDQNFAFLNQFVVQSQSCNYLTIMSSNNDITTVEKIHFLNCNLKVIKSTIHKSNKYIGSSFSSEIRIS